MQRKVLLLALGTAIGWLSLVACSASPSGAIANGGIGNYTVCYLPTDQGQGSFMGAWSSTPIPVILDNDFYLTNGGVQATAIKHAISTWNNWASLKGRNFFTVTNDGVGAEIPTTTDCSQTSYTAAMRTAVGIWKIRNSGTASNIRGCGQVMATGVQGNTDWMIGSNGKIIGASILLNYSQFNSPGGIPLDTESLVLHELGHVAGLLHSCNGTVGNFIDITSAPLCAMANANYQNAVMFPYLLPAQLRRSLTQNDYNRINCLY